MGVWGGKEERDEVGVEAGVLGVEESEGGGIHEGVRVGGGRSVGGGRRREVDRRRKGTGGRIGMKRRAEEGGGVCVCAQSQT